MRHLRILAAFGLVALLAAAPARGDGYPITQAAIIAPGGDCTAVTCSSASKYLCRNSASATTLYACNTGTSHYIAVASLGSPPGGSSGQVQINSGGAFGGDSGLTYDLTRDVLTAAVASPSPLVTSNATALANFSTSGQTLDFADLKADLTLSAAAAPTLGTTFTSLGFCNTSTTYLFGAVFYNTSGHSAVASTLSWKPNSGTSNRATINMPTPPATATAWSCVVSADSGATWKGCVNSSPTANDILPTGTASQIATCSATGTAFTNANTSGPMSVVSVYDQQFRMPGFAANTDADDPRWTANRRLINFPPSSYTASGTWTLVAIDPSGKVCLDGTAGCTSSTYLIWDVASQQIQVFVNGTPRGRITQTGLLPGDCVANNLLYTMNMGDVCNDPVKGRTIRMTDAGPVDIATGKVAIP